MGNTSLSTTQSTQQSDSSQFFLELAREFGTGFSQEIFVFFLLAIAIAIRDKAKKELKNRLLYQTYFQKNSLNDQVKNCLIEILRIAQADRVLLLQLHNGEAFFGRFQQLKVTLTHQYVENGITEIEKIVSLPVSYIFREFNLLRERQELQWVPIEEADSPCQKYLDKIGVKLYGSIMIRNELDVPIAIFGFHYCSHDYIPIINNDKKQQMINEHLKKLAELLD